MSDALLVPLSATSCDVATEILIIGAGAAGLVAALAARENGADVLVVERDVAPAGSTSLSAGLVPAAGTRFQAAIGVDDSAALFAADIAAKNHELADPLIVDLVARESGPAVAWLADAHGLPFSVIDDFTYPGHTRRRMHGLPTRSGRELIDRLRAAAESAGVDIVTQARATQLIVDEAGETRGAVVARQGGAREAIAAEAVILACNGYGADRALVAQHLPALAGALYFGHPGNDGDALRWGEAIGAASADLSGHQGHGSVAHPHGVLITWAAIVEGGVQINLRGERFHDESRGYSEAAADVLAQPGGVAWTIFDARIETICAQFEDYRQAQTLGAILHAPDVGALAARISVPDAALRETLSTMEDARAGRRRDPWGRDFARVPPLTPPFRAVRTTGALFHTQGGLEIDAQARVKRRAGGVFARLFAAGGAARGVSGPHAAGYLSGNGLLSAVALGRIAGGAAARSIRTRAENAT